MFAKEVDMGPKVPGNELPYKPAAEVIGAEPDNQPKSGLGDGYEIPSKEKP